MKDLFSELDPDLHGHTEISPSHLSGFRLDRLDVLNWGTFDGAVHSLALDGETTLLVGQNGAGKSTLVDALLTLLVRPGKTRNYNLAAGANKAERNETSYILGAYDRRSQEEDNRGEVRYLRQKGATYSVLLACFRNRQSGQVFTLAQLLYLSDGTVERVYCFSNEARTIARDFSALKGVDKLPQEMRKRGFKATTKYTEYFEWFRNVTGVQDQAMDMFNQTVAVKDIQRLNDFIRKHMLEARPWGEKVDDLFRHFKDLSDAHRELERVRQQRDLLEPIERHGSVFRKQAEDLLQAERILVAADSYFSQKIVELFEPEITRRQVELGETRTEQERLKSEITVGQDECRRLQNEIEQAGGARLREIPLLIRTHETEAASRRANVERLTSALRSAGLDESVSDSVAFDTLRLKLAPMREQLQLEVNTSDEKRTTLIESRVEPVRSLRQTEAELQILMQRQGNLPPEYVDVRKRLCDELRLSERELPFAAELIAVKPDQRHWEGSIEMVLRGFALSLLVPERHYKLVSRYVERTPLRDSRGNGQKLVYLMIAERERQVTGPTPDLRSLIRKLDFRDGWSPLLPWVKAEVRDRHNILCCDTIEEFQQSHDRAITHNRHFKQSSSRHEKDDRNRAADPRYYILGWDNKEKKRLLAEVIKTFQSEIDHIDSQRSALDQLVEQLRRRVRSLEEAERFKCFAEVDFLSAEQQILELRLELKGLEENNDTIRILKQRLAETQLLVEALQERHNQAIRRDESLKQQIDSGKKLVDTHLRVLARYQSDGSFISHRECFADFDTLLSSDALTIDNYSVLPDSFRRKQQQEVSRLRVDLKPLEDIVVKAMSRFLNANADERLDLDHSVQFLPDFLKLLERIRAEDLPQFEDRFKERLNEKVGQEIGILRGNLHTERSDIEDRIQLLNVSLRQVQYGLGTHMRLVARPVRDREIGDFRQELDACVSGQFEGTLAADEARYKQIESLISKLRDEERWRAKVTDVRNWFDFAAVETDDVTGSERSYHDDSAGQSGGEKAKLAFTILIAAIAFQYDLDPHAATSNRFHFVVVDEMFSRVDDGNSSYALELFRKFGLQLLIVAPLDAKARVTENFVGCYLHVSKDEKSNRSRVLQMTASEFQDQAGLRPSQRPTQPR